MTLETVLRFMMALGGVLALILILAWIARRSGFGGIARIPSGRRRLAVVEALALDPRRRLVIVRRDATEHLILLGHSGETVLEHGIAAAPAFTLPPVADEP